jgi:Flp pilus assembly pilin Flp
MRENAGRFWREEDGMGTVEVILIIVLIGLVIIFKKQITDLVNNIFKTITSESNTVTGD